MPDVCLVCYCFQSALQDGVLCSSYDVSRMDAMILISQMRAVLWKLQIRYMGPYNMGVFLAYRDMGNGPLSWKLGSCKPERSRRKVCENWAEQREFKANMKRARKTEENKAKKGTWWRAGKVAKLAGRSGSSNIRSEEFCLSYIPQSISDIEQGLWLGRAKADVEILTWAGYLSAGTGIN